MPKQNFDVPGQKQLCERMHYNPWNAIEDHTPTSDTNQARGIVYAKSAEKRTGRDWTGRPAIEPAANKHPLYRR
jgi:hypothetical protein